MTYLITGATGNVGSLVVERLIERGDRPRVFVRDADKARARYGDCVDVFVGDLSDAMTLRRRSRERTRSYSSTRVSTWPRGMQRRRRPQRLRV
jgi:uncharacterized protein YbjT (DUF2867 family)